MAALRTLFKRTASQNSNQLSAVSINTDSTSDSSTNEHLNNPNNENYSSTSTLGVLTITNDDSLRRPLLRIHSRQRKRNIFSCFMNKNSTTMDSPDEQILDENICLIDKTLPKELLLR